MVRRTSKNAVESPYIMKLDQHTHCACVEVFEAEVAMLKRQLADKARKEAVVPAPSAGSDWLAGLHPADRRFMQKKLGLVKGKE